LAHVSWEDIETLNQFLCSSAGYQIGRTSDGYDPAKKAWETERKKSLTIEETALLCRRCHGLAPFLFLNGNTFVAIARDAIIPALAHLSVANQSIVRGTIGHFVAGTIGLDEMNSVLQAVIN
jgi:hypothetical protein